MYRVQSSGSLTPQTHLNQNQSLSSLLTNLNVAIDIFFFWQSRKNNLVGIFVICRVGAKHIFTFIWGAFKLLFCKGILVLLLFIRNQIYV